MLCMTATVQYTVAMLCMTATVQYTVAMLCMTATVSTQWPCCAWQRLSVHSGHVVHDSDCQYTVASQRARNLLTCDLSGIKRRRKPVLKTKEIIAFVIKNLASTRPIFLIAPFYQSVHFTRPPASRYGHRTDPFIKHVFLRASVWARQIACTRMHAGSGMQDSLT
jgi:hypothetical protein